MKHVEDLTSPPVPGRYYIVPTVTAIWHNYEGEFPVIGPAHNDRQHLKFEKEHYHLDSRFMPDWSARFRPRFRDDDPERYWLELHRAPVLRTWGTILDPWSKPPRSIACVYPRKWLCKREAGQTIAHLLPAALREAQRPDLPNWRQHLDHWAGRQCRHDGRGWVCPHRNVPLASQPVINGVITCPLHALMIDDETGKVLDREHMADHLNECHYQGQL